MPKVFPLINELERRTRALGSSWEAESRRLGFDRTTLAHVRSGRTRVSLTLLHRIAAAYPTDDQIKRLAWEYLLHDVETLKERHARTATLTSEGGEAARRLGKRSQTALAAFVADFPRHAVDGTGLLLESLDAALLTSGLDFVEAECRIRSIHTIRRRANAKVSVSEMATLSATPLLLVDRSDYVSPAMEVVLANRAAYRKVVVTSRPLSDSKAVPGFLERLTLQE
jgi:hypothetical protein